MRLNRFRKSLFANFNCIYSIYICILMAILLCQTVTANAAPDVPSTVPSTVEPGRVSQEINPTSAAPEKGIVPSTLATVPVQPAFPKQIAAIKFKLRKLVLEGNTAFSDQELLALFPKKVGTVVTLGDIQQFVNAITVKYNAAGYVLSQALIPAQTIAKGIIHIKVMEGFIDKVMVQGEVSEYTKARVQIYGDKVVGKKPLNLNDLESTLLLANDIPGLHVKSVLTPSKSTPGAASLTLLASHNFFDSTTSFSYDNRGTRYIGPERTIGAFYLNTMLGAGASSGLRVAQSGHWNEMRFVELEHKQYFGTNGLWVDVDMQYTRTWPNFILLGTNTIGVSKYLFISSQYPLWRHRNSSLFISAGFNDVNIFQQQFNSKLSNDQIRTIQVGVTYNSIDKYKGVNQISYSVMQGLNILGASQPGNLVSRFKAKPVFTKTILTVGRLQGLTDRFSLMLTANGQTASNRMYSYQQIGYGGLLYGNAYDPSEILGDHGLEGKIELRLDNAFPYEKMPTEYFIYYDAARLWNYDHITQVGKLAGTSAGFGVRATLWQHISWTLELDKPLDRKVAAVAAEPNPGNPKAWRGFFSVGASV